MLRMGRPRFWLLAPELLMLAKGEGPLLQEYVGVLQQSP